jgi:hypothetical protein
MSAFESALQAGMGAVRSVCGVEVTYARGATTLTLNAVQTSTQFETLDGSGLAAVVEAVEWLIAADDLTTGDPQIGDTITRTIDGTSYTYTVEHPGQGVSLFEFSDTSRTQYRIRTREDGVTAYTITQPNGFDLSGTEIRY